MLFDQAPALSATLYSPFHAEVELVFVFSHNPVVAVFVGVRCPAAEGVAEAVRRGGGNGNGSRSLIVLLFRFPPSYFR